MIKIEKAIIVIHEAATGPGHDLKDYLLGKNVDDLLFIAHPLFFVKSSRKNSSYFELYKKGKLIKKHIGLHYNFPEIFLYIKDTIYTILWSFTIKGKIDLYVGLGNLNAIVGILLRFFGKVDKSIYYVIDYIPNRFQNPLLNSFYHQVEKICALYSDRTWNLSPRMIEERNKKWNRSFPNQYVVLHGVHFDRIHRVPFESINKTEIIYMGGLLKKQGVQIVLEALPIISKRIKNIMFTIIGSGEYKEELERLVKKLRIEKYVQFLGYIADHHEVENRLAKAAIAIAMYEENKDNFTYYTDPGKVKNYLGAAVPVLITDVPYIARVIEKAQCGIIVSYDKDIVAKKLIEFLTDLEKMKAYRKNSVEFAKKYDWDKIFTESLS